MLRKSSFIIAMLVISATLLASCKKQAAETPTTAPTEANEVPTAIVAPTQTDTPTPMSTLCSNVYQPTKEGDTWTYSGNNTSTGDYTRTDTITKSSPTAFTLETEIAGVKSKVEYNCTADGLVVVNPIEQYVGTLLAIPNSQVNVKLLDSSGVSLPAKINPGDTWQQSADWDVATKDISTSGSSVFDYTAVGIESVTVPFGTFDALRIDTTISVAVSALKIPIGTYEMTTWYVPEIGMVKSEGTSHIRGVTFSDQMQLTQFVPAP